jgi:copper transport protein
VSGVHRRLLLIAVVGSVSLLSVSGVAGAHANLVSSAPANGETLQTAPDAVTLTFTEAPEPSLSSIRLLDASGTAVAEAPPSTVDGDRLSLTVPLSHLEHGVYTVSWRAVSRVDGHATAGAFAFGVGETPSADVTHSVSETTEGPSSPIEIAGRWALLAGLVALVGGAVTAAVVLWPSPAAPLRYLAAAWAVAALGLALLAWAQVDAAGAGLRSFLVTPIGRGLAWRAAGIVMAGVALGAAAMDGRPRRRAWLGFAAAGAAGASLAHVAFGHAAAARLSLAQVTAQWVHVTAVALWIGGLGALLVAIRGEPDQSRARAVRRFSTMAGFALAAVVGTGLVRAFNQVRTIHDLFFSDYGRVVLVKVVLLLALATLGAVNRSRNLPRSERTLSGLRRVSRAELAIATAVLGATALLASLSPPSSHPEAHAAPGGERLTATGSDFAESVRVTLVVEPGHAGSNRFMAHVADYDTGEPVHADRVALRFSYLGGQDVGESTLELRPAEAGVYEATAASLSIGGRWGVTVLVQQADDSVEVPLVVATHCLATAMATEEAPTIYTVALPSGSVQGYVDPGIAGVNQIHLTFFDAAGEELAVDAEPEMTAWRPEEDPIDLEAQRLGPGHFAANLELAAGRWRLEFSASLGEAGGAFGCFEETVQER